MNINKLWNNIYQEEAGDLEGSPTEQGEQPPATESLLDDAKPELSAGEWYLADGIKGTGEKPEWYLADKYGSLTEQAKGYSELQKKFGSFTGAPKDGYALKDGVDKDDPLVSEFIEMSQESGASQEFFDKAFDLYSQQMGVNEEISAEKEMAKLGDNAAQRIKTVETALKTKFGDDYDSVKDMVYDANSVMLAEAMIKKFTPTRLPIDGGENPTGLTWGNIEAEMFKKDSNGQLLRSVDREHEAKIQRMMKDFGGDKPNIQTFG